VETVAQYHRDSARAATAPAAAVRTAVR
jgi:hypothetical protein